jgi:hypothetical protein
LIAFQSNAPQRARVSAISGAWGASAIGNSAQYNAYWNADHQNDCQSAEQH